MQKTRRTRIAVTTLAIALSFSTFPATASGATEVPNTNTSTASNTHTESLSEGERESINQTLGYEALPAEAAALKSNGEKVTVINQEGKELPIDVDKLNSKTHRVQTYGVKEEIKRTVGACLGIDFAANIGAWEAIESQGNTWQKAAKFVLRRVGVIAAVSCGGGVFAEYLL